MAANRTVSVALIAKVQGFTAGVATATKSAKDFRSELDDLGKKSPGKFNDIAQAAAGAGLALVGMAGYAVKAAAEFDKQMSEVAAVSNATGKELGNLRQAALQAGKDTQFSATEAAQAEAELAKAGLNTSQILGGALKGSMALAAAGQMNLADAATITAQTLNVFQLQGSQAGHVADVLASAANTSAADMHDLGLGLGQVGLVAHQVGFSLEETVGLLAAFADRGLAGSDGATSLKVAIQRLMAPTSTAQKLMQRLGIDVYDANGHMLDAAGIAEQLQQGLNGLGDAQKNAALYTLFGNDAIRAGNILLSLGADGVRKYTNGVDQMGAASQTASKKMDNLAGDVERLKGSIETMAISAGSGANTGLRVLVQTADHLVGTFLGLPSGIQTAVTVLLGLSGGGLLAAAGLMKVRQTAKDALDALRDMGPTGGKAADALGKIGGLAAKAGAVATAIFAVYEGFKAFGDWIESRTAPVTRDVDKMANSLKEFAQTGKAAGEVAKAFGPDMHGLLDDLAKIDAASAAAAHAGTKAQQAIAAGGKGGGAAYNLNPNVHGAEVARVDAKQAKEDIGAFDTALTNLVNAGKASVASLVVDRAAEQAGISIDELRARLPNYTAAAHDASVASAGLAQGFGDADANARTMNRGLEDAIAHGQTLTDVFKQLNGAALDWAHAEDALNQSFDDAAKSVKENGKTLDVHTEKGRANRAALEGIAEATGKAVEARFQDTGSLEEANKVYEEGRQKFIANAMAMGLTKQKAEELANQWMKMPATVATTVLTPGMQEALSNAKSLHAELNGMTGTYTAMIHVVSNANSLTGTSITRHLIQRWGGVTEHAQTGLLREAGMYAAGSRPLYAFAEPQTRGEAFIPHNGNLARSRNIADYVVSNWLGGRTSWGGGAAQAAPVVHVYVGNEEITSRMRVVVDNRLGQVARSAAGGPRT